jgi:phosphate transport system permease protein
MRGAQIQDRGHKRLPTDEALRRNIAQRRRRGSVYRGLLFSSVAIALAVLGLLLFNITNEALGLVALEYEQHPDTLADRPFDALEPAQLIAILQEQVRPGLLRFLNSQTPLEDRSLEYLRRLVLELVAQQRVVASYPLVEALFNRAEIEADIREDYPNAKIQFYSWINWNFITSSMSRTPELSGVRTAILGSLWMIGLTIIIAFPIGIGAAIYLEEYATANRLNRIIQTNINNLAGVPSIIYGLLGLAIFVRALGSLTSGQVFGIPNDNGRTILAASLTMALLILPLIIINAQEAIRAVPRSLRQASYALGATKWQTIWHHVLPVAFPGILTGNILAMSRAIGETAPLIVIGASTYITTDPSGPFSKFTVLPIQIYNWTSQPQETFRDSAAAAIIVLLITLLTLNSVAVFLRNHFRKSL